jgi:hypothetical protein
LALFGLIGALVGFLAVLDPVGAQLANDSAPFAEPSSVAYSLFITFAFLGVAGFGVWLFRFRPKEGAPHV